MFRSSDGQNKRRIYATGPLILGASTLALAAVAQTDPVPASPQQGYLNERPSASAIEPSSDYSGETAPGEYDETLASALASTFANSAQLLAQRAGQRALEEDISQARAGRRPTLNGALGLSFNAATTSFGLAPSTAIAGRETTQQFNVTQPIFNGFRNRNSIRRAKRTVEAGEASLIATEQTVLLATITSYMDILRDQDILRFTLQNLEGLRQEAEAIERRFNSGDSTGTDIAQALSAVATSQSQVADARSNLEASRSAFLRLTGRYPNRLAPPPALPQDPQSVQAIIDIAIDDNPLILEARLLEDAARYSVREAQGALSPTIDITSGISRSTAPVNFGAATGAGDLIDTRTSLNSNAGINFRVPIYQGGAEFSSIRRAKKIRTQRKFEVMDIARQVEERVRVAYQALIASRAAILANTEAVRAADFAVRGTRRQAAAGIATSLDLLNTQENLLNAQINLARAQRDLQVASYTLLMEIGQLTHRDLNLEAYDEFSAVANFDENAGWRDYLIGFAENRDENRTQLGVGLGAAKGLRDELDPARAPVRVSPDTGPDTGDGVERIQP